MDFLQHVKQITVHFLPQPNIHHMTLLIITNHHILMCLQLFVSSQSPVVICAVFPNISFFTSKWRISIIKSGLNAKADTGLRLFQTTQNGQIICVARVPGLVKWGWTGQYLGTFNVIAFFQNDTNGIEKVNSFSIKIDKYTGWNSISWRIF